MPIVVRGELRVVRTVEREDSLPGRAAGPAAVRRALERGRGGGGEYVDVGLCELGRESVFVEPPMLADPPRTNSHSLKSAADAIKQAMHLSRAFGGTAQRRPSADVLPGERYIDGRGASLVTLAPTEVAWLSRHFFCEVFGTSAERRVEFFDHYTLQYPPVDALRQMERQHALWSELKQDILATTLAGSQRKSARAYGKALQDSRAAARTEAAASAAAVARARRRAQVLERAPVALGDTLTSAPQKASIRDRLAAMQDETNALEAEAEANKADRMMRATMRSTFTPSAAFGQLTGGAWSEAANAHTARFKIDESHVDADELITAATCDVNLPLRHPVDQQQRAAGAARANAFGGGVESVALAQLRVSDPYVPSIGMLSPCVPLQAHLEKQLAVVAPETATRARPRSAAAARRLTSACRDHRPLSARARVEAGEGPERGRVPFRPSSARPTRPPAGPRSPRPTSAAPGRSAAAAASGSAGSSPRRPLSSPRARQQQFSTAFIEKSLKAMPVAVPMRWA